MSKVIDETIEKEIKSGLDFNYTTGQDMYSYILPKFFKNDNGEYVFSGNVFVSTIKEYRKYKKAYGEIAKHLSGYKRTVGQIYKNALNSMIADNSRYQLGANAYSLSSKILNKSFTASNVRENTSENYSVTLSYLTKAAFKTKRLTPTSKLNDLMKNAEQSTSSRICVLPVMTDNGIVLNHGKNNKATLEASFKTVSYTSANDIKNYLFSATEGLPSDASLQIKTEIEKLFKEARQIGELVETNLNDDIADRLEKLAIEFSDLIGIDLTHYDKTPVANNGAKHESKSIEKPVEDLNKEFETSEILIDGSYKTTPVVEDGRVVTKLTPDGLAFSVQLKENKLNVKTIEEDPNMDFDMLFK